MSWFLQGVKRQFSLLDYWSDIMKFYELAARDTKTVFYFLEIILFFQIRDYDELIDIIWNVAVCEMNLPGSTINNYL
jgi:hypothetical protein